ncbi:CMRF35-like molecule 5 isoform X3 [Hemicordylus capensis]|uniref:CMRF35-like molecule 5 isoform X3 n=1 Tax=Hemicordylus capensis TaxID=884348 RepID=UPI002303D489|nr:CMRF35-like molecule 5 isoform X3 [Hemicordylus capensis]
MKMLRTLYLLIWVLTPGCLALTGPAEVTGYIGGSLRLSCHYEEAFEQNTKFWCKGYQFIEVCSSSITKSESEEKVEKDRVSIEDNKKQHYFNVTMDKLRLEDDGFYQCGIERRIIGNIRHSVQVTISLGPEGITTKQPELNHPIKTTESNTSFTPSKPGKSKSKVVIYCIVLLFILLLLAAVVLVVVSRKKKRGFREERGSSLRHADDFRSAGEIHLCQCRSCLQPNSPTDNYRGGCVYRGGKEF